MPRNAIIFDSDEPIDKETLADAFDKALEDKLSDSVEADLSSEAIILGVTRDDWEPGKPCPNCGHDKVSAIHSGDEIWYSNDGNYEFKKRGDLVLPSASIMCLSCMATLESDPGAIVEACP